MISSQTNPKSSKTYGFGSCESMDPRRLLPRREEHHGLFEVRLRWGGSVLCPSQKRSEGVRDALSATSTFNLQFPVFRFWRTAPASEPFP